MGKRKKIIIFSATSSEFSHTETLQRFAKATLVLTRSIFNIYVNRTRFLYHSSKALSEIFNKFATNVYFRETISS